MGYESDVIYCQQKTLIDARKGRGGGRVVKEGNASYMIQFHQGKPPLDTVPKESKLLTSRSYHYYPNCLWLVCV